MPTVITTDFRNIVSKLKVPFTFSFADNPLVEFEVIKVELLQRYYRVWLDGKKLDMSTDPHIQIEPDRKVQIILEKNLDILKKA